MLIGKHYTTEQLVVIMNEKITDLDMESRKLQKEYAELSREMASNPPQKNRDDERPMKLKNLHDTIEGIVDEIEWLEGKVEEAEKAIELDPKVATQRSMLSLNDMIRLGVEDPADETEEE